AHRLLSQLPEYPFANRIEIRFRFKERWLTVAGLSNAEVAIWKERPPAVFHQVAAIIRVREMHQQITRGGSARYHSHDRCRPARLHAHSEDANRLFDPFIRCRSNDFRSP